MIWRKCSDRCHVIDIIVLTQKEMADNIKGVKRMRKKISDSKRKRKKVERNSDFNVSRIYLGSESIRWKTKKGN